MAGIKITTDTTVLPVSLTLAKEFLRIDSTDTTQDDLLTLFLHSARDTSELRTARSFIQRAYREYFDCFPGNPLPLRPGQVVGFYAPVGVFHCGNRHHFELSRSPLATFLALKYLDVNGVEQTVDPAVYIVNATIEPATITLAYGQVWPCPLWQVNSVYLDYVAGYSTDDSLVPAIAKNAILLMLNHLNENRDSFVAGGLKEVPYAVENLLELIRVYYQP